MLIAYLPEYKGIKGTIEFSSELGYHGRLVDIKGDGVSPITYRVLKPENLYSCFVKTVDQYLKYR